MFLPEESKEMICGNVLRKKYLPLHFFNNLNFIPCIKQDL